MPATRPRLADDLARLPARGVVSTVVCLEDSVADEDLPAAEENAVEQLRLLAAADDPHPALLFLRPRRPDQLVDLVRRLGEAASGVDGFALPKFDGATAARWFAAVAAAESAAGRRFAVMPILETAPLLRLETRRRALAAVRRALEAQRDRVLAVRIGATDLSALHGLRRPPDLTIWDVGVVAGFLADAVNVLGRADGTGFTITGSVWEHYSPSERLFKPLLRESPFAGSDARALRRRIVRDDLDGLIREVVLDAANGLTGKTVIHPEHVAVVHALSVVPAEEHADALDILAAGGGGATASRYGNKMNEAGPHRAWAQRTLTAARMFGVAREGVGLPELLAAQAPA